jgi:protein-S-isoprenylcysteine O-methyltransferase Ste14
MKIDFEKHRASVEKICNVLGALVYIVFVATFAKDIYSNHRLSSFFPLAMSSFFFYFFLVRDLPRQLNLSPYHWLIALYGTFLPLYFRPPATVHDSVPFIIIQAVGISISIAGILSLNKSIGLTPANRGVKTIGAYKFIRHPIYAGYFLTLGGYCLQNFTQLNVIIFFAWMTCETLRMFAEEKYLSQDPAYAAYMKKVPWRILPYIF